MKVCFDTFGCRLNRAEALQREAEYLAAGWEVTDKHSDANLIIVRGCSVTAHAQRDCERLLAHLKRRYPFTRVIVEGCLKKPTMQMPDKLKASANDAIPTRTARAYLKVQDGCNGKCTFCIVPQFRGNSVSLDFTSLLDRAKRFIDAGYHEIVITGCNLSLYASQGKRLAELAAAIAGLDAACRVRIGSIEPGDVATELVSAMAETPNICRFLHIPIQSGSDRILIAMNRPYRVKDVDELATTASKLMPKIGLGCDMMTGFPGEFDVDQRASVSLLERLPISNAHVFKFSPRPNTPAANLSVQTSSEESRERAHELAKLATKKRSEFSKKFIGELVDVLIEDTESQTGWSGEYFGCHFIDQGFKFERKSIIRGRVIDTKGDTLTCVIYKRATLT